MNDTTHNTDDDRFLDSFVTAARQDVDDADVAEAARRFRERLPEKKPQRSRFWQPRFATAAVLVTGLALSLQLFVPGGSGNAFADVQEWFLNYRTLETRTVISLEDEPLVTVQVQATANGHVRIEQANIVSILNAENRTFATLMPGNRYFEQPVDTAPEAEDSLEWVEKLGEFRGEAERLEDARLIDGQTAVGHRLKIDDIDLVLWSNSDNDAPILLEGALPGGLQLESRFAFNVALEPDLFQVPEGYILVEAD